MECTILETGVETDPEASPNKRPWVVYVDRSSNDARSGVGMVLESSDRLISEYALRFGFKASNNVAEYEAMIAGINMAKAVGEKKLRIRSNSRLVVGQAMSEFEAREEMMKRYQEKVRRKIMDLDEVGFEQTPRDENERADALARLASSPTTDLRGTM